MREDVRGLALSTDCDEVATLFDRSVAHYLEYRLTAMDTLKALLARDGDFVMGRCLQGYFYCLLATHRLDERVAGVLAAAEAGMAAVTQREAAHVRALRAWHQGDLDAANAQWERIITEHPHDLLALRLLHFNSFWMGESYLLRDAVAGVLPTWDDTLPGYGSVLGMYAFGLEECGEYARAEQLGREAVGRNPDDLWAIHAVAHVLEMQGRVREGAQWLDYPFDAWDDRNPFRGHLWWHRSLFALEAGDLDEVLALYDRCVRPEPSDFYLDIQNAASLLQRLALAGADVGARWRELADVVEAHIGDHVLAFNEMHTMMALAADRRFGAAARLLDSLREFAITPHNYAASVTAPAVLPLCEAVLAFHQGDYARVVALIAPRRYRLAGVGGSHAQRDVFTQLLTEASLRGTDRALGFALLRERVSLRPGSPAAWRRYAEALAEVDAAAAAAARARAEAAAAA